MEGGRGGEGNAEVNNNNGSQAQADQDKQKVAFYKLFSFADRLDVALMIVGTICAVGNGLSQPLMTLVFGNLINTFGSTDPGHIVPMISKVSLKFLYLAIGTGAAALLQVACWMVTGERQAARIRGKYMKAILRQDIGFFDTETSTGEIIGRISGDTILIQEAMGEKTVGSKVLKFVLQLFDKLPKWHLMRLCRELRLPCASSLSDYMSQRLKAML